MIAITVPDLFLGGCLFLGLFSFQALLWHFADIPRQWIVLFSIFLLGPVLFFALGILELPGFIFSLLLSCNYISAFPVLQASSPTLVMLEFMFKKKSATEEEIGREMARYGLVEDRMADLEKGSLIFQDKNGYALTTKGNLLATFFIVFRKSLALQQGAG